MADLKRLEQQARDGPSDPYALAKWRILNRLHDRNETMYYKVSPLHFVTVSKYLTCQKAMFYVHSFLLWFLGNLNSSLAANKYDHKQFRYG